MHSKPLPKSHPKKFNILVRTRSPCPRCSDSAAALAPSLPACGRPDSAPPPDSAARPRAPRPTPSLPSASFAADSSGFAASFDEMRNGSAAAASAQQNLGHELEVGVVLLLQLLQQSRVLLLHLLEGLAGNLHLVQQSVLLLKVVKKNVFNVSERKWKVHKRSPALCHVLTGVPGLRYRSSTPADLPYFYPA